MTAGHLHYQVFRCAIVLLLICAIGSGLSAQNLISNGSFEDTTSCPRGGGAVNLAIGWEPLPNHKGTPDYMHRCNPTTVNVPDNFTGYQEAFHGDAYMGMYLYIVGNPNFREYIHTQLTSPLVAGLSYRFRMMASLADVSGTGTDDFSILLTDTLVDGGGVSTVLQWNPQASSNVVLTDTGRWDTLTFVYRAKGGEQYLMMGNFTATANMNLVPTGTGIPGRTYVYIDDVTLEFEPLELGPDQRLCLGDTLFLQIGYPGATWTWSTGSTDSILAITQPGCYSATLTDSFGTYSDTICVQFDSLPNLNLGPDTFLCEGDSLLLDASLFGATYLWLDGSTDSTFLVTESGSGTFWVQVSNTCDTVSDFIDLLPQIAFAAKDTFLCSGDSLSVFINLPGTSLLWNDGSTDSLRKLASGSAYWVDVTNSCGTNRDSIILREDTAVQIDLGPDTAICAGDSIIYDLYVPGRRYYWSDGSRDSIRIFSGVQAGTYQLTVANNCNQDIDTLYLVNDPQQAMELGPDTVICIGDTFPNGFRVPGASHLWSDGDTSPYRQFTDSGFYWLEITSACGIVRDTFVLDTASFANVDVGPDTTLCPGDTLWLSFSWPNATYNWTQPGFSETDTLFFDADTVVSLHLLIVSTPCGNRSDFMIADRFPTTTSVNLGGPYTLCAGDSVPLQADTNFYVSYLWDDGSTDSIRYADSSGLYWLEVNDGCVSARDSVELDLLSRPSVSLGPDTTICPDDSLLLSASGGAFYQWQNGRTDSFLYASATGSGTYWLEVVNSCGSDRDSITVLHQALPTLDLGPDTSICPGAGLWLSVPAGLQVSAWNDGSSGDSLLVNTAGLYWLQVQASCGADRDSVLIDSLQTASLELGPDISLCDGDSIRLQPVFSGQIDSWQDGSTDSLRWLTQAGLYWLEVSALCNSIRDSIQIQQLNAPPSTELGSDTLLCDGAVMNWTVPTGNHSILWSDGSNDTFYESFLEELVWIELANGCDTIRDSIQLFTAVSPSVDLGPDSSLCLGETLRLDAGPGAEGWIWQDGSNADFFEADQSGWYWVVAYNSCDSARDSVLLDFIGCDSIQFTDPCYRRFPNAFSPNMDPPDDAFRMLTNCPLEGYEMRIFNRWGETIHITNDNDVGWDGSSGGKAQPLGVYVYYVYYLDENGERILRKGSVTLIR